VGDILLVDSTAREDARVGAAEVVRLVGLPMTAFLANLESTVDLRGRLDKGDGLADDGLWPRLRFVLVLAEEFRDFNAISRFKAWLREVDAKLGPTFPAALIRHSHDPETHALVSAAADRYLRGLATH
jgi:hypothetical protein